MCELNLKIFLTNKRIFATTSVSLEGTKQITKLPPLATVGRLVYFIERKTFQLASFKMS